MGCIRKRAEQQLNLHSKAASNLDRQFKKWASQYINQKQLEKSLKDLGTSLKRSGWFEMSKTKLFYSHFKTQKGYNLNSLIIVGVILTVGSNYEKAKLIFENLDSECSGFVSKDKIKFFLTLLGELLQYLIELVDGFFIKDGWPLSQSIVLKLRESWKANFFLEKYQDEIMESQEIIKKESFISKLVKLENGQLLHSWGIKQILNRNIPLDQNQELQDKKIKQMRL